MIDMQKFVCSLAMLLVVWLLPCSQLPAGLIIQVQDAVMISETSHFVDVYIYNDAAGQTLGRFDYKFQITGVGLGTGDLQFSMTQETDTDIADPVQYVFPTTGLSINADPTTLVGGDSIDLPDDFIIFEVDQPRLLARLELTHFGLMSVNSHDFIVSLVPGDSVFDRDFDPVSENDYATFTSLSGKITVVATPEPSSMVLVSCIAAAGGLSRLRRKRAMEPS